MESKNSALIGKNMCAYLGDHGKSEGLLAGDYTAKHQLPTQHRGLFIEENAALTFDESIIQRRSQISKLFKQAIQLPVNFLKSLVEINYNQSHDSQKR